MAAAPALVKAPQLYRGLAHPITKAKTVPEILACAKMAWSTEAIPAQYQFNGMLQTVPDQKVLVRSDTGKSLAIVSDKFKVHQNSQIIDGLAKLADAGNINITHGGCLEGGAVVFLHGSVKREFDVLAKPRVEKGHVLLTSGGQTQDLDAKARYNVKDSRKIGDIVSLNFSLRGGHRPGTPTVGQAVAMRLACYNGALVSDMSSMFRLTHLQNWQNATQEEMVAFVARMVKCFDTYEQKVRRLQAFKMSTAISHTFVVELVQPEVLRLVVEEKKPLMIAAAGPATSPEKLSADQIYDEISNMQVHEDVIGQLMAGTYGKKGDDRFKLDRSTKQLAGVLENQPGFELSKGTAWNAVNAVTYYVDHFRGRNDDHCVESSLQGHGAKLKTQALDLALTYTERSRN